MFYRLIVIENSLTDKSILEKYPVLSETIFARGDSERESRMLKVRVSEQEVNELVQLLEKNIIYPYYAHLYHEDPKINKLIVIFQGHITHTQKNNFKDVVNYGIAHDVAPEEMDVKPRDVTSELW